MLFKNFQQLIFCILLSHFSTSYVDLNVCSSSCDGKAKTLLHTQFHLLFLVSFIMGCCPVTCSLPTWQRDLGWSRPAWHTVGICTVQSQLLMPTGFWSLELNTLCQALATKRATNKLAIKLSCVSFHKYWIYSNSLFRLLGKTLVALDWMFTLEPVIDPLAKGKVKRERKQKDWLGCGYRSRTRSNVVSCAVWVLDLSWSLSLPASWIRCGLVCWERLWSVAVLSAMWSASWVNPIDVLQQAREVFFPCLLW